MLTFAIGDVHGCFAKLATLMQHCANYADATPFRFIFLGDYIDRGPDSRGCVARLIEWTNRRPDGVLCLKGNHEDILLSVLAQPSDVDWWLMNGGDATLASYHAKAPEDLPPEHIAWMKALPLYHDDGLRFFVHAGVDPTIPLDKQTEHTLLWTRERYPETINPGRFIVHGHTPLRSGTPEQNPHRLNLDTAAVFGGPLTAAAFNDQQRDPIAFLNDRGEVEVLRETADAVS